MQISHIVVSRIQAGGLAVSLYGLFYLSLGLFPPSGVSYLRPLLPAGAMSIAGLIIFAPFFAPFAASPLVLVMVVFAFGYSISYLVSDFDTGAKERLSDETYRRLQRGRRRVLLGLAAIVVVLAAVVLPIVSELTLTSRGIEGIAANATNMVVRASFIVPLVLGFMFPPFLAPYLSKERLQIIGLIFAAAGLVTGFLPAILDVANIVIDPNH